MYWGKRGILRLRSSKVVVIVQSASYFMVCCDQWFVLSIYTDCVLEYEKGVENIVRDGEVGTDLACMLLRFFFCCFLKSGWCRRMLMDGVKRSIHAREPGALVSPWTRFLVSCPSGRGHYSHRLACNCLQCGGGDIII